jgi:uncharacterized protein (TIGR00255 family)
MTWFASNAVWKILKWLTSMKNSMTNSMTGFAAAKGETAGFSWVWDMRSVNARGLDIRLRVPDWIDGLEPAVRSAIQKSVARGSVSLSLKVARDTVEQALHIDPDALDRILTALKRIEVDAVASHDMRLSAMTAADVFSMPGVTAPARPDEDTGPLAKALLSDLAELLSAFNAMRGGEGKALAGVITGQLDQIAALVGTAKVAADARRETTAQNLRDNLARVLENSHSTDPDRVAQELAMIATKADVTEELDRMCAHVAAARALLAADGPVGRKLDFLAQEFMREANTLCSKAQSNDLTRIGLDLKAVIDQMREQVQNLE